MQYLHKKCYLDWIQDIVSNDTDLSLFLVICQALNIFVCIDDDFHLFQYCRLAALAWTVTIVRHGSDGSQMEFLPYVLGMLNADM